MGVIQLTAGITAAVRGGESLAPRDRADGHASPETPARRSR